MSVVYPPNSPVVHPEIGLIQGLNPTTAAVLSENNTDVTSILSTLAHSPDFSTVYLTNGQFFYAFDLTSATIPLTHTQDLTANHLPAFPATDAAGNLYFFVTVVSGGTTYHLYKFTSAYVSVYDKTPFTLTDAGGHRDFFEVSADGATLYWAEVDSAGTQSILHAYDLTTDMALPDILTSAAGEVIKRIHRDPLSTSRLYYSTQNAAGAVTVYHITTAGLSVFSFSVTPISTARVDDFGVSPDGLTVWTSGRTTGGGAPTLRQWLVSDGSLVVGFAGDPDAVYGRLTVIGARAATTITVRKTTAPVIPSRAFSFTATPDLTPETFTLHHGEEQVFEDVAAGTYSVVEAETGGWDTSYSISNGGTNTAIVIADGDNVIVTVTNSLPYQTIRRLRRSPHINEEKLRIICDRFELDLQAGLGTTGDIAGIAQYSDPIVMVRVSRDGGQTWGPERQMTAGAVGEYQKRCFLTRLGQGRDLVFEVTVSDPVMGWYLVNAYGTFRKGTS